VPREMQHKLQHKLQLKLLSARAIGSFFADNIKEEFTAKRVR
jgi:hypothetical protein